MMVGLKRNICIYSNEQGFTFLELITVMVVVGIISAFLLPSFIKSQTDTQIAEKIISDLKMRQEAIRWYYYDMKTQPPDWNTLKTAGYLPNTLPDTGPFGVYTLNNAVTNPSWISSIEIENIPDGVIRKTVINTLGNITVTGNKLSLAVIKPGQEPAFEELNNRLTTIEDRFRNLREPQRTGIYCPGDSAPKPVCNYDGKVPLIYVTPVVVRADVSGYPIVAVAAYASDAGNAWIMRGMAKATNGQVYTDCNSVVVFATTYCGWDW